MPKQLLLACILAGFLLPAYARSYGEPVDKDSICKQAEAAYLKGDNLNAQHVWGTITIKGSCGEGDLKKGFELIEDAANRGNKDAIYKYAQLIYDHRPDLKSEVPKLIAQAANLGQLDALAAYGSNKLDAGDSLSACIYYGLALKSNPNTGGQLPRMWGDTYARFKNVEKTLDSNLKTECKEKIDGWHINTDVIKYVESDSNKLN